MAKRNTKGRETKEKSNKRMGRKQVAQLLAGLFESQPGRAFSMKEIFRQLKLTTHPAKMLAMEAVGDMAWDDYVKKTPEGKYALCQGGQVQEGTFVRKANGKNSFVPDGGTPVFVPERSSLSALNGDRVKAAILARRKNHIKEAQVIEIVSRDKDTFVGRVAERGGAAFLATQDNMAYDILIPADKLNGARHGQKAIVKVETWPDAEHRNIIGRVEDVLGECGQNDTEMHAILAQYGLPYRYPANVEAAAGRIPSEITPQDMEGREDFRGVFTCTIDPKDAKDFDDALSIRRTDNGLWEVGVHIADVSHYVKEGSVIDREALKRATSIYLVDRTIPMLPERLCNEICSLRPDEDKLCYSVIFHMDEDANVKASRIVHTAIRSDRRYAYEEVQQLLEDNGVADGTCQPAPAPGPGGYKGENAEALIQLDTLAKKLRRDRFENGSVNFESEEMRFDIDAEGRPVGCYFKRSKDANKLIEEFMLLANRTVAESIGRVPKGKKAKTIPYRVHDNPDPQKLEALGEFIAKFGYRIKTAGTKGATARSLNKLMADSDGSREQKLIQTLALRAMSKAKYTVHNIGHFGLAFDHYTHFTSPIRRYPDTLLHRLLTRYAEGGRSANTQHTEDLCDHCSQMEIVAQNAERDSVKYKMVEYMADKIGNTYPAHISGVTSYGIYCEIDENHCEGLVPMRDLDDDYYEFDERNYCLVGRRRKHRYQLGDAVTIKVAKANMEKRLLDFTIDNGR